MQILKERQEKARVEAIADSEQVITELNRRHEREKLMLREDNNKLHTNINLVSFVFFCFGLFVM